MKPLLSIVCEVNMARICSSDFFEWYIGAPFPYFEDKPSWWPTILVSTRLSDALVQVNYSNSIFATQNNEIPLPQYQIMKFQTITRLNSSRKPLPCLFWAKPTTAKRYACIWHFVVVAWLVLGTTQEVEVYDLGRRGISWLWTIPPSASIKNAVRYSLQTVTSMFVVSGNRGSISRNQFQRLTLPAVLRSKLCHSSAHRWQPFKKDIWRSSPRLCNAEKCF